MKNPSKIDFKKAQNYPVNYTLKIVDSLGKIDNPKLSIKTLNNYIYNVHNKLISEVIRFQSEREYRLINFKGSYKKKYANYLMNTLPTLCLAKSERLDGLLEDLGLSQNTRAFFVNKQEIDLKIHDIISNLKIAIRIKPELEAMTLLLSYLIIGLRCYAHSSEEIHGYYSKSRKVIHLKGFLEGEMRKIRSGGKLHYTDLPEEMNDLMNSPVGEILIKNMNGALSKNKSGSYNVSFLASLIFGILKSYSANKHSDDEILFELAKLFRLIYEEKNIIANEEDFNAYNPEDKSPIGDSFRDHVVKKCKSITSYEGSNHNANKAPRYELNDDFDFFKFLKLFLGN